MLYKGSEFYANIPKDVYQKAERNSRFDMLGNLMSNYYEDTADFISHIREYVDCFFDEDLFYCMNWLCKSKGFDIQSFNGRMNKMASTCDDLKNELIEQYGKLPIVTHYAESDKCAGYLKKYYQWRYLPARVFDYCKNEDECHNLMMLLYDYYDEPANIVREIADCFKEDAVSEYTQLIHYLARNIWGAILLPTNEELVATTHTVHEASNAIVGMLEVLATPRIETQDIAPIANKLIADCNVSSEEFITWLSITLKSVMPDYAFVHCYDKKETFASIKKAQSRPNFDVLDCTPELRAYIKEHWNDSDLIKQIADRWGKGTVQDYIHTIVDIAGLKGHDISDCVTDLQACTSVESASMALRAYMLSA